MRAIQPSSPFSSPVRSPSDKMKPEIGFTRGIASGAEGVNGVKRDRDPSQTSMDYVRDLVRSGSTYELRRVLNAKEKYGIDVNAPSSGTGGRLLHEAFEHNVGSPYVQSDVVKELLNNGADPNLKDHQGRTPLDLAAKCAKPNPPAIAQLLNAGAQVSDFAMQHSKTLKHRAPWMPHMLGGAQRLK